MKSENDKKKEEIEEVKRIIRSYFDIKGRGDYPHFEKNQLEEAVEYFGRTWVFDEAYDELKKEDFSEYHVLVRRY